MREALKEFKEKRILLIGDICLDRYRIIDIADNSCREADIPILRYTKGKEGHKDIYSPGAGGNIACNLSSLDAKVSVLGVRGDDYNGYILQQELIKRNIDTQYLFISETRATITFEKSYDILNPSKPIQRWDTENNIHVDKKTKSRLIEALQKNYKNYDAILAADYCEVDETTAIITEEILSELSRLKENIKTFGCSRNRIKKFKDFYCLVPNDNELIRAVNNYQVKNFKEEISLEEIFNAAHIFYKRIKPENLVVTIGKKGAISFNKNSYQHIPTKPLKENIDITGCGDTFIATLALADLSGLSLSSSIKLANISAGLTAQKLGTTGTSTINELIEALEK